MLWEELITEGHVLAARLRKEQSKILSNGIIFVVIGSLSLITGYEPEQIKDIQEIIDQRLRNEQDRASSGFLYFHDGINNINDFNQQMGNGTKAEALPEFIKLFLDALNKNDELPEGKLPIKIKQTPEEFWQGEWQPKQIAYMEGEDAYLMGAKVIVKDSQNNATMWRWLGLFKKQDDKWHYASLYSEKYNDPYYRYQGVHKSLYPVPGYKVINVNQVAPTLLQFVPDKTDKEK